jgi:hypothetical protein
LEALVSDVLDAIPPEARAVIVDELTRRNPALLAELRGTREPTSEQLDAVNHQLAAAVVKSLGPDWNPDEYGMAIERAVGVFNTVWPRLP